MDGILNRATDALTAVNKLVWLLLQLIGLGFGIAALLTEDSTSLLDMGLIFLAVAALMALTKGIEMAMKRAQKRA